MKLQHFSPNSFRHLKFFAVLVLILVISVLIAFFWMGQKSGSFLSKVVNPNIEQQNIELIVEKKYYRVLMAKREEAVERELLLTSDDDFVPAKLKHNGKLYEIRIRLKGDLVDHLKNDRWSFRIKLKDDQRLWGMRTFSVQLPQTRNYLAGWLIQKVQKFYNLLYLRSYFIGLKLNGKFLGLYMLEEHFDDLLINNNLMREGVILAFSDDVLWKERFHYGEDNQAGYPYLEKTIIRPYQSKKVLNDKELYQQFMMAKSMLEDLKLGKTTPSKVFDIDHMAKFLAIADLFGGVHSTLVSNLHYYFNPVTQKLYPIGWDHDGLTKINQLVGEVFFDLFQGIPNYGSPLMNLWDDKKMATAYLKALDELSNEKEFKNFFNSVKDELYVNVERMIRGISNYVFPVNILKMNYGFIKRRLNPITPIKSFLSMGKLSVANVHELPVKIYGVYQKNTLIKKIDKVLLPNKKFYPPKYFNVSVLNVNNIEEVSVEVGVLGTPYRKMVAVNQFGKESKRPYLYTVKKNQNIKKYSFIRKEEDGSYYIRKGNWVIRDTVVIPQGSSLTIAKGSKINLMKRASIVSYSPLILEGTKIDPIIIYSADKSGEGIAILKGKKQSVFTNVVFSHLKAINKNNWNLTGAISLYESDSIFRGCKFNKIDAEDALNIIRSSFSIISNSFTNVTNDAIDVDFSNGIIEATNFKNVGNDAVDLSGAKVLINRLHIANTSDKGISVGENSQAKISNIVIVNAKTGIASKDYSDVRVTNLEISDSNLGLASFQKKPEFGNASIVVEKIKLNNVRMPYLIETDSQIQIDKTKIAQRMDLESIQYLNELKRD